MKIKYLNIIFHGDACAITMQTDKLEDNFVTTRIKNFADCPRIYLLVQELKTKFEDELSEIDETEV
jgi:hypothetical protein